jgi:hypothetical protein
MRKKVNDVAASDNRGRQTGMVASETTQAVACGASGEASGLRPAILLKALYI